MNGLEFGNILLAANGGLLVIVWWSLRNWMGRVDSKLDRMEARQAQTEKDCVTWTELEKVNLKVGEHDRRLTVMETTCKSEHGSK
jgi:hypothetical protein